MRSLYRYGVMLLMVVAALLVQFSQYQKVMLENARIHGEEQAKYIAARHDWNMQNGHKIKMRMKVAAILAEFEDSLQHDPEVLADLIIAKADEYRLDPLLVLGVIKTESDFNRNAVSPKGAIGLMQIRPATVEAIYGGEPEGVEIVALADNEINISLGTRYLARLIHRFGDLPLALEAYNRGPTRLRREMSEGSGSDRIYAKKVMANYHHFRKYPAGQAL